jgi:hypothetical protein
LVGYSGSDSTTAQIVLDCITDAQNEINKYLGERYDVTLWQDASSNVPSDLLFFAGFESTLSGMEFTLSGAWTKECPIEFILGTVTLDTVNDAADFDTGVLAFNCADKDIYDFDQKGCIRFKFSCDHDGAPVGDDEYLVDLRNNLNLNSGIVIKYMQAGNLFAEIYDQSATLLHTSVIAFSATANTFTELEYNFNLDSGYEQLSLNGVGGTKGAVTGIRSSTGGPNYISFGGQANPGDPLFPGYLAGKITDIELFNEPQHLVDFTSEIPRAKRVITYTTTTVPPLINTICKWYAAGLAIEACGRGSKEALNRSKILIDRAKTNLENLESGALSIVDANGNTIDKDNDPMQVLSNTKDYPSTFDEDDPLRWKVSKNKNLDIASDRRE